jgi:hypothetical protein
MGYPLRVPPVGAGALVGDRYRLDRKLGQGGMGVVWAAIDTTNGTPCAVKLLTSTDDEAKRRDLSQRLRREARAASAVEHPNLVRILDVLELEDGSPALVMEYLDGESLAARLARERVLALGDFAKIFVQILAGVEAVHAHKIIHRDLKPENVFLVRGPPPCVKVLDFGIAKQTATEGAIAGTALTVSGAVIGTPLYMSPEQFSERDIDARTDVWSLGLIAYRCLSGVLPWQADNAFEVYRMISTTPVTPLEEVAQGMPEDVTRLVRRMLSRKREDRLAELREVALVFAPYAEGHASASLSDSGRMAPPSGGAGVDEFATTYLEVAQDLAQVPPRHEPETVPRARNRALGGRKRMLGAMVGIGVASLGGLWIARIVRATPPPSATQATAATTSIATVSSASTAPSSQLPQAAETAPSEHVDLPAEAALAPRRENAPAVRAAPGRQQPAKTQAPPPTASQSTPPPEAPAPPPPAPPTATASARRPGAPVTDTPF